jgi:hypothetical protein
MRLEERIVIARDIGDLWAFFMDIQNLPKWDRSVARVQATSDNGGVGAGFTFDTFATLEATAGGTVVTCVSDISLPARHLWLALVLASIGPKAIRTDLAELKRVTEAAPGDAAEAASAAG